MKVKVTEEHTFYKAARSDGWDFHTGKTINYREAIGRKVECPKSERTIPALCTSSVIHASRVVTDVLLYVPSPMKEFSLFEVKGSSLVADETKSGFKQLEVIQEIPSTRFEGLFGFKYSEVLNPLDPRKIEAGQVGEEELRLLARWASVRASVRASYYAYLGTLFPGVNEWKYTENVKGLKPGEYPFQSAVDLLRRGFIAATDEKEWFLLKFKDGKAVIAWRGKLKEFEIPDGLGAKA